ncbi:unnamed protein product [Menidia menidia]|uniref:GDP-mannose 4,6-dehydratase n=1 Tax=Menidia menidia TaxID=238744 RepID=A0A8S4ACS2_9TELE|nr:unnamed protein product [Menidia menidia]
MAFGFHCTINHLRWRLVGHVGIPTQTSESDGPMINLSYISTPLVWSCGLRDVSPFRPCSGLSDMQALAECPSPPDCPRETHSNTNSHIYSHIGVSHGWLASFMASFKDRPLRNGPTRHADPCSHVPALMKAVGVMRLGRMGMVGHSPITPSPTTTAHSMKMALNRHFQSLQDRQEDGIGLSTYLGVGHWWLPLLTRTAFIKRMVEDGWVGVGRVAARWVMLGADYSQMEQQQLEVGGVKGSSLVLTGGLRSAREMSGAGTSFISDWPLPAHISVIKGNRRRQREREREPDRGMAPVVFGEGFVVTSFDINTAQTVDNKQCGSCYFSIFLSPPTPFFQISFELAEYTANVDGVGTLRLLDAIKTCGLTNSVKFYQASTSELYGKVQEIPQKETTPFYPRSPYGAAKLYAYWIVVNFREAYNMFAVNGILFNHESPRRAAFLRECKFNKRIGVSRTASPRALRDSPIPEPPADSSCPHPVWAHMSWHWMGDVSVHFSSPSSASFSSAYMSPAVPTKPLSYAFPVAPLANDSKGLTEKKEKKRLCSNFVTRKISRSVAKIHLGQLESFSLGNLDSKRDWGHAMDYVEIPAGPHRHSLNGCRRKPDIKRTLRPEDDDRNTVFVLKAHCLEMHQVSCGNCWHSSPACGWLGIVSAGYRVSVPGRQTDLVLPSDSRTRLFGIRQYGTEQAKQKRKPTAITHKMFQLNIEGFNQLPLRAVMVTDEAT